MAFNVDSSVRPPQFFIACDGGEYSQTAEPLPEPFEGIDGLPWIGCTAETEHAINPREVLTANILAGWLIVEDSAYCPAHAAGAS